MLGLREDAVRPDEALPGEAREALRASGGGEAIGRALERVGTVVFRPYATGERAREALLGGALQGYFVLVPGFLESGRVDAFFSEGPGLGAREVRRSPAGFLQERLITGRLEGALAARVLDPIADWREWSVSASRRASERHPFAVVARIAVPLCSPSC